MEQCTRFRFPKSHQRHVGRRVKDGKIENRKHRKTSLREETHLRELGADPTMGPWAHLLVGIADGSLQKTGLTPPLLFLVHV